MIELIAKRLENLKSKRYFPSPEFEHMAKINTDRKNCSVTQAATRSAASADTVSKAAIAAAATSDSVIGENMRLAIQFEKGRKPTASKWHTTSREPTPQAVLATATCPATPEGIWSYYVRSSGQYPNISVPSCVVITKIQSTNYPTITINWLRQPSFDDNSQISYIKKKQSLLTKNWTAVTTTYSNPQSTPLGQWNIVVIDKQEKSRVYTPYPRSNPCVYAISERERDKY